MLQTARDASWQDPLTCLGLSVTSQSEQPAAPTVLQDQQWRRMQKGTFHQCAQVWNVHGLWLTTAFIHLVCDLVCGRLERYLLIPCHTPSFIVSSVFLLPGRFLWTALCPQCSRLELIVRNGQQILVCLSLLGCWTLTKSLRAGRSVRLWIKSGHGHSRSQEAHFPNHFQCFDAKTVTSTLVSPPAISEFPGFSAVWNFNSNSRMLPSTHHSRNFGISTIVSAPNHDSDGEEFSGRPVISSTTLLPLQREAARSAMAVRRLQIASRACRSANCVSKAVIDYLVQQNVPETLVSEDCETFSGRRRASQCQCSFGSCGYQSTC